LPLSAFTPVFAIDISGLLMAAGFRFDTLSVFISYDIQPLRRFISPRQLMPLRFSSLHFISLISLRQLSMMILADTFLRQYCHYDIATPLFSLITLSRFDIIILPAATAQPAIRPPRRHAFCRFSGFLSCRRRH